MNRSPVTLQDLNRLIGSCREALQLLLYAESACPAERDERSLEYYSAWNAIKRKLNEWSLADNDRNQVPILVELTEDERRALLELEDSWDGTATPFVQGVDRGDVEDANRDLSNGTQVGYWCDKATGKILLHRDGMERFKHAVDRLDRRIALATVIDEAAIGLRMEMSSTKGKMPPTKKKRSTQSGEAREKIVAVLSKHHDFATGSCLNTTPIGVRELARQAAVAHATVSDFFTANFECGYPSYKQLCNDDVRKLADSIEALRGETTPAKLMTYGRRPPNEGIDDEG